MKINAIYVSIWDGDRIETPCKYDTTTNTVSEIETVELEEDYNCCYEEFIELPDGTKIKDFINGDEED